MSSLGQDARFAARTLVRSPGFTTVALLTLAIGIGASTAIFSIVNAVLLAPLRYPQPERLVAVYQTLPSKSVWASGLSYPNFTDFARDARSFEGMAAIRLHDYTLTGQGEPTLVVGGSVTANLFSVLGGRALLGRGLVPADGAPEAPAVAVLSERIWRERFGADPAVVGRTVTLDARPATVVGVMPATFKTPPEAPPTELWLTLAHDPVFGDLRQRRGGHYLKVVARLAAGVSIGQAQAELATIGKGLSQRYPTENEGWDARAVPLAESLVGDVRKPLFVLLGAVALVFLIACANVANLLLARASARGREVAIRAALGAGRARLAAQLGTECVVLALAGGLLGLLAAYASVRGLRAWLPADLPRISEIGVDARVLVFSLVVSLAAAVVFGLAPILQLSGGRLFDALKEGGQGSGESGRRLRLRSLLVVVETAVSFMLLVGAGLLGKSFLLLSDVNLGFRPEHVLTAGLSLPRNQYSKPEEWIAFYRELVDRLKTRPGVDAVAAALPLPLTGSGLNFGFQVEGRAAEKPGNQSANYTAATADYFRVMGIRLLSGRLFGSGDTPESAKVCLISEAFARRTFPGEDPLGKRLVFGFTKGVSREIVGVVGDVRRDGLASPSQPEMYVPFGQDAWWAAYLALRTTGDPARLSATVRNEVRALDPTLPIAAVEPMGQFVTDSVAQPRFRTSLLGLFAATALVLSLVGLYGVVSYNVGRRTREVGVRMALGARGSDVVRLVLANGLGLAGLGLAAGLAGAFLVTRWLSGLLYGVSPLDPATYAGVALLFLAALLSACYVPARRATQVDPVRALRAE
jgi:predicted permease